MKKLIIFIFFIVFAQHATATTIEAELAKIEAYEYESIDYRFRLKGLENSETWCTEESGVKRCVPVVNQISVEHDLNFIINKDYKVDIKYDELKKKKSCEQWKVIRSRKNEWNPFYFWRTFYCVEENNIIKYTFKYFPDIKGVGLDEMLYATCSSNDFNEYKIPLLKKFNSFTNSQSPKIYPNNLSLNSPLSGEFLTARLVSTKNSAINCQGDSALGITIKLYEYQQSALANSGQYRNKGWHKLHEVDLYTTAIKKYMTDLAKQNIPKF